MATTYNHAQIGVVDASGNVNVIYPITTGADVSITRSNTKLPTAATTAQALANALGKLAFVDSEISDSETSTTKTWSSKKISDNFTSLSNSFQAGVDTLYNKCVNCGSTPSAKTPTAISNSIQTIYTNRYSNGRTQGQNDVKGSPNSYGLYTSAQYTANYNSGYTKGVTDADARVNTSSANYQGGYNAGVTAADGRSNPSSVNYQSGYNTGRVQGQNDVKGNPAAYGISVGIPRPENWTIIPTGCPSKATYNSTGNHKEYCACTGEWVCHKVWLTNSGFTETALTYTPEYTHCKQYEKTLDVKPYRSDYAYLTQSDFIFKATEYYAEDNAANHYHRTRFPEVVSYTPSTGLLHVRVFITEDDGYSGFHGNFCCMK